MWPVDVVLTYRWGSQEIRPTRADLERALAELSTDDEEHPDCCLEDPNGWALSIYQSGLVVWENVEEGEPRHMKSVSRKQALNLWLLLAAGRIEDLEREPWLPGYG